MEKKAKLKYILYAIKNNKNLKIETQNNKKYEIKEIQYNQKLDMLEYTYATNANEGRIKLENILNIELADEEEQKRYMYKILSEKYNTNNLKTKLEEFEKYYLEIIEVLLENEEEGTKGYLNLINKKKMYPNIFENLYKDEENLLFNYFTSKKIEQSERIENEILLLEQANLSQKGALENALKDKISIIQGPPGTGKTTTIINILVNLIYQNKKVLVVSKNNSAIENVAEDLEKMEIPKSFIRMRKFRCNEV